MTTRRVIFLYWFMLTVACLYGENHADPLVRQELLRNERFEEIRVILKKTSYPINRSAFLEQFGALPWIFHTSRGRDPNTRHFSYFALEPEVKGAGRFCLEAEFKDKASDPSDTVVAGRICFISRFGAIFYEAPSP